MKSKKLSHASTLWRKHRTNLRKEKLATAWIFDARIGSTTWNPSTTSTNFAGLSRQSDQSMEENITGTSRPSCQNREKHRCPLKSPYLFAMGRRCFHRIRFVPLQSKYTCNASYQLLGNAETGELNYLILFAPAAS